MIGSHCGRKLRKLESHEAGYRLGFHTWQCDACGRAFKQATRKKEAKVTSFNWRGMPSHVTDQWLFWKLKNEEIERIRSQYDVITAKLNKEEQSLLEAFIMEMRSLAVIDYEFNSSEGA